MKLYIYPCVTFILLTASVQAKADMIYLQNGDRISGHVLDTSNDEILHFRTSFEQDIILPRSKVKNIEFTNAETKPQPAAPVVRAVEEPAPEKATSIISAKWTGRVNFGATIQTGNTDSAAINADAMGQTKWLDKHRVIIKAEYNREKENGKITDDNQSLEGTYDYFFRDKWFLNNTLKLEQDDINKIDLRTTYSAGLGYQAFESDDLNLKFILGPSYLHTSFTNNDKEDSAAIHWATNYDQKLFNGMLQIFHDHDLIVPTDDTEDFLLDTKTGMRIPLKNNIIATAQVEFNWDNAPEASITEDDTKYILMLGYEW